MKKVAKLSLLSLLYVLFLVPAIAAKGGGDNELTGVWYGGSTFPDHQGYKYQYTFTPSGPDMYMAMADGAYGPVSFGAGLQTKWTGEVRKLDNGDYEIRLISLITGEPVEPPNELPNVLAVVGDLKILDSGEVEIKYQWYGSYMWGRKIFVDKPDVWFLYKDSPPIVEIIERAPGEGSLPDQPKM